MPDGNPIRGRFNAWFVGLFENYMHAKYGGIKRELLRDAPQTIIEIGPGAGANLRYYASGARVIAIEPNPYMHDPLRRRAASLGVDVEIRAVGAESIDLPDDSADLVLSTLVLCTVPDPAAAIRDIRRVLRPGGRFLCIEHVAAPRGTFVSGLQRVLRRPWRWCFEGCELQRDIGGLLENGGFGRTTIEPLPLKTVFLPIRHQIVAACVK